MKTKMEMGRGEGEEREEEKAPFRLKLGNSSSLSSQFRYSLWSVGSPFELAAKIAAQTERERIRSTEVSAAPKLR